MKLPETVNCDCMHVTACMWAGRSTLDNTQVLEGGETVCSACRDWSDCGSGTDSGQEEEEDDNAAGRQGPKPSRFSGSPR